MKKQEAMDVIRRVRDFLILHNKRKLWDDLGDVGEHILQTEW